MKFLFKKKSELEQLQEKYNKLMSEYHRLSSINRMQAEEKFAEAEMIGRKIETLKNK